MRESGQKSTAYISELCISGKSEPSACVLTYQYSQSFEIHHATGNSPYPLQPPHLPQLEWQPTPIHGGSQHHQHAPPSITQDRYIAHKQANNNLVAVGLLRKAHWPCLAILNTCHLHFIQVATTFGTYPSSQKQACPA